MHNQQMKHLMRGAWILSLSPLIAKILSAVYRVPFQNMVGDTGFYAYQQIYPIYGLGMTFALSGQNEDVIFHQIDEHTWFGTGHLMEIGRAHV